MTDCSRRAFPAGVPLILAQIAGAYPLRIMLSRPICQCFSVVRHDRSPNSSKFIATCSPGLAGLQPITSQCRMFAIGVDRPFAALGRFGQLFEGLLPRR